MVFIHKKLYHILYYEIFSRLNSRKIKDHYEVLGLSKKANQKEIKQAFIDLSKLVPLFVKYLITLYTLKKFKIKKNSS